MCASHHRVSTPSCVALHSDAARAIWHILMQAKCLAYVCTADHYGIRSAAHIEPRMQSCAEKQPYRARAVLNTLCTVCSAARLVSQMWRPAPAVQQVLCCMHVNVLHMCAKLYVYYHDCVTCSTTRRSSVSHVLCRAILRRRTSTPVDAVSRPKCQLLEVAHLVRPGGTAPDVLRAQCGTCSVQLNV